MSDDDFNKWLDEVETQVSIRAGVSMWDLPDQLYRDMFDNGVEPVDAATAALEAAGWEGEL